MPPGSFTSTNTRTVDDGVATYVMRHDGTGYFAGNVIRVMKDRIMVGENVMLNKTGLSLVTDEGIAVEVTNKPISSNFESLNSGLIQFGSRINPIKTEVHVGYHPGRPGWLYVMEGTYHTIDIGYVNGDSTGTCHVSLDSYYSIYGEKYQDEPMFGSIEIELRCDNMVVSRYIVEVDFKAEVNSNNYLIMEHHLSNEQILLSFPKSGSYSIRFIIPPLFEDGERGPEDEGYSNLSVTHHLWGSVKNNLGNQTTIGSDGMASIWNQSALAINENAVVFRHGKYGFRLNDNGIQYTLSNGVIWKELS